MASFVRPISRRQIGLQNLRGLGGQDGEFPRGGYSTYRFAPQRQGREYDAMERDALAHERESRIANYEQMQQELAMAKERRQEAEHQMATQKLLRYEQMMSTAIKKIGHINPADPKAEEKWNQVFQEHPELFHNEKGLPSLTPYYEQYQRLAASAQSAKEKQQAAAELQKQHQEEINTRHQQTLDLRKQLQDAEDRRIKEAAEAKKEAKLNEAKSKHETYSDLLSDNVQDIRDTEAQIERLNKKETKTEDDKYNLFAMAQSLNRLKEKKQVNEARVKGLQKQYPELDPNYVPPEEKSGFMGLGDKAGTKTGPAAIDTAQPDVPAIRKTAPVSGGTATPSGDMIPLGTETQTTPSTAAAPADTTPANTPSEWDTLTEQMHRTNSALDKAHQRRNAAMDTLAKMGPGEYLNPFSTAMDDATKALQSANEEIDKHDSAYKDFFDKRGALIKPAGTPAVAPVAGGAAPVATTDVAPHPYEGKRVKQKSTGQYGTFVNGQFVPEEQEAMDDQPTPELSPE